MSERRAAERMIDVLEAAVGPFNYDTRHAAWTRWHHLTDSAVSDSLPYGTRLVDGVPANDTQEQQIIVEIVEHRKRGDSYREIAAKLESRGLRQGATAWHPNSVRRICLKHGG